MRSITLSFSVLAALVLAGGCIISDELTTITILPDGSADWVRFQSNIRSTESGLKGKQELQKFANDFDARCCHGLTQGQTSNPTEAIDADADGHGWVFAIEVL